MQNCEKLIELVRKESDVLRRRGSLFRRISSGIEEGEVERMREACRDMEELDEQHGRLQREVVECLKEVCAAHGVPKESASLGRLVEALNGDPASELASARRDLAGALALAREAGERAERLASVASEWNAHVLGAVWSSVPGGQTYSPAGEMETPEGAVLEGAWG